MPILKKNGVVKAGIFGSMATGKNNKKSDIDFSNVIDIPLTGLRSNDKISKINKKIDNYSFGGVLIPRGCLQKRITKLAKEISNYYLKKNISQITPIFLMKGAVSFGKDFCESMDPKIEQDTDYMCVSSYGSSLKSSKKIKVLQDLTTNIKGKCVLLIDDIFDTGNTIKFTINYLKKCGAKNVKTCVLLNKRDIKKHYSVDFIGFNVPDVFIVGYGMDYDNRFRNIPYIFYIK